VALAERLADGERVGPVRLVAIGVAGGGDVKDLGALWIEGTPLSAAVGRRMV